MSPALKWPAFANSGGVRAAKRIRSPFAINTSSGLSLCTHLSSYLYSYPSGWPRFLWFQGTDYGDCRRSMSWIFHSMNSEQYPLDSNEYPANNVHWEYHSDEHPVHVNYAHVISSSPSRLAATLARLHFNRDPRESLKVKETLLFVRMCFSAISGVRFITQSTILSADWRWYISEKN